MNKPKYALKTFIVKNLESHQWAKLKEYTQFTGRTHSEGFKKIIDELIFREANQLKLQQSYFKLEDEYRRQNEVIAQYQEFMQLLSQRLRLHSPLEEVSINDNNKSGYQHK